MLVHRTVGIVLASLNCHVLIVSVVVSLLLADSCLVVIRLFICSRRIFVVGYYHYYCLSDDQRWLCTKVCIRYRQLTIWLVVWQTRTTVSCIICSFISCICVMRTLNLRFCEWAIYHYHYCWKMVEQFNVP